MKNNKKISKLFNERKHVIIYKMHNIIRSFKIVIIQYGLYEQSGVTKYR